MKLYKNTSYFRTQSKCQQTQNRNNPLHHIRTQQNKTRPQQQKNPQKILKHMETEKHTLQRKKIGDRVIKEEFLKFLESNDNENTTFQNL
jgi:hypothetical protein